MNINLKGLFADVYFSKNDKSGWFPHGGQLGIQNP